VKKTKVLSAIFYVPKQALVQATFLMLSQSTGICLFNFDKVKFGNRTVHFVCDCFEGNFEKTKKMKTTLLKIGAFLLLFALVGVSCKKDEEDLSYLDNEKIFEFHPGAFAIYKTKNDYFFNVSVTPMQGYIFSPELKKENLTFYKGKYHNPSRFRLNDNYIVSIGESPSSCFTSLSFDEYVREELAPVVGVVNQKVIDNIVDRNPFTEFYRSPDSFNGKTWITIDEMNSLIREKRLGEHFIKIK
jgi:hypothetical protein